ncbi:hypothetical protein NHJ13051_002109 [Beauveria bassiana]
MKFLTVAAAIFASTSLAVPTNNHNGGGACVPRPNPGNSNTSSAPGGNPTGGHTNSGPGTKPTGSHTSSTPATKPTDGNTSSGPATKPTGSHTSSGPATKPTDGNTSSGPGTKPTGSHTSSTPATKPTDDNTSSTPATKPTDGNTSSGPGTKPTGSHTSSTPATNPTSSHTSSGPGTKPTDDNTSSTPATKPTDGNTSSGPGTKPTDGHTSSVPGTKSTSSHTNSVPATTTTGSNTGSHTSSGPSTTSTGHPGGEFHCPAGLYSNPQCCSADVLGVLGLDCDSPSRIPISGENFKHICAAVGKEAKCCVIPVAGQDLLCLDPITGGQPTSVPGGQPTSLPSGNPTSVPGGHPTSAPTGHPTSVPGGQPTSVPGGNPTSVPGHPNHPPGGNNPSYCPPGLYSVAQCCSTDVLGVADLDCSVPSDPPGKHSFKEICAEVGKQAKCCVLPVAGQDLLCQDAIDGGNSPSHPTSVPSGHPTSMPGGRPTSVPGSNPTSVPGGNPTSVPSGHPTSVPGGNPTSVPVHPNPPPSGNNPSYCPPGLYSNPQCCSADVLGVLGLDCSTPGRTLASGDNFERICAAVGKQAKCCVLPVAGQDLLCQDAIDGGNSPSQPTSAPGGQPTSIPGGNPTSVPGGSPTSVPGHHNPPPVGNDPYYCPSGLYSNPQCCAVDVLGVADLDCSTPSQNFTTGDEFRDICATIGQHPMCCVLPVAGQAVLCEKPVGI